MTWVVPTIADVYARMSKSQTDATRETGSGGADPFDTVMPQVVARVRRAIANNPRNKLSATANSVPPSLLSTTAWLIVNEFGSRIFTLELNEKQTAMVKDAKDDLKALNDFKAPWNDVEQPDNPESSPSIIPGPYATLVTPVASKYLTATKQTLKAL